MTDLKRIAVLVVLTLTALSMSARGAAAQAAPGNGGGAAVYAAQKCSLCHALDGKGSVKGPLDGVGSKLTADEIRQWIVTPVEMTAKAKAKAERKPVMKAYPSLPKEDLDALVAFLSAKKKK